MSLKITYLFIYFFINYQPLFISGMCQFGLRMLHHVHIIKCFLSFTLKKKYIIKFIYFFLKKFQSKVEKVLIHLIVCFILLWKKFV